MRGRGIRGVVVTFVALVVGGCGSSSEPPAGFGDPPSQSTEVVETESTATSASVPPSAATNAELSPTEFGTFGDAEQLQESLDHTLLIRDRNVETAMVKLDVETKFADFKLWAESVCTDAMRFEVAGRVAHSALVTGEDREQYEILRWVCPTVERYVLAIYDAGLSRPPDPDADRNESEAPSDDDGVAGEAPVSETAEEVDTVAGDLDDCLTEIAAVCTEWEPLLAPIDWDTGQTDDELLALVEPMYPGGQRLEQAPCPFTDADVDEAYAIMLAVADDTGPGVSGWLRWGKRQDEIYGS